MWDETFNTRQRGRCVDLSTESAKRGNHDTDQESPSTETDQTQHQGNTRALKCPRKDGEFGLCFCEACFDFDGQSKQSTKVRLPRVQQHVLYCTSCWVLFTVCNNVVGVGKLSSSDPGDVQETRETSPTLRNQPPIRRGGHPLGINSVESSPYGNLKYIEVSQGNNARSQVWTESRDQLQTAQYIKNSQ